MKKLVFIFIAAACLISTSGAWAVTFKESIRIKGEVTAVYDVPQVNESIPIPELRKPYFAKIKILEDLSSAIDEESSPDLKSQRQGKLVPIHKMAYKEPIEEGQIFIGKLHYNCNEYQKYKYTTCEVTLEIEEFIKK